MIPVLVHFCYGGFSLSDKCIEYLKTVDTSGFDYNEIAYSSEMKHRCNRVIIDAVQHINDEELSVQYIPEYMVDYSTIHEYDGAETIILHKNDYKIDKIKEVIQTAHEDTIKLNLINAIINLVIPDVLDTLP
jgi:hypothetical protein